MPGLEVAQEVEVLVEVARGGLVKWGADGGVDFVSPVPCPFNYGSVPARLAPDGDPADALVLGPRVARGERVVARVVGTVRFLDDGQRDDKLICLPPGRTCPPTSGELRRIRVFFLLYAQVKRASRLVRGRRGPTRFEGIDRSW